MNSYQENLRESILSLLQGQQLEQKNLQAKQDAASLTLYHAQAAVITAAERWQAAGDDTAFKAAVNKQAAGNTNLAGNQLSTAQQAAQYQEQAVTNASVAAASVQVAANAIGQLASITGNVYGLIQAADLGSDLSRLAGEAWPLVNDTAQRAEVVSHLAMEASILTAEVSAPALYDKSKAVHATMRSLLDAATASLQDSRQELEACDTALADAGANAKKAEGRLDNLRVSASGAIDAYDIVNRELNLDLAASADPDGFTVRFRLITSPFPEQITGSFPFPVSDYCIIVVKELKASLFPVKKAEELLLKNPECCTQIILTGDVTAAGFAANSVAATVSSGMASARFDVFRMMGKNGQTYVLQDSDGETLLPGVRYTIFLFAVYQDEYKRRRNNFDDFLSAPSLPFCITARLVADHSGSTGKKKAETDGLTLQVSYAQYEVDRLQAGVTALNEKVSDCQRFLVAADSARTNAYNNKMLGNQVIQQALDLRSNAGTAFNEAALAKDKATALAEQTSILISKLICSSENINKLAGVVIRKKSMNPLISDELVSLTGTAGTSGNNAVALTLVALQSVFAAQASATGSAAALGLAYAQSRDLYAMLITKSEDEIAKTSLPGRTWQELLHTLYVQAKANHDRLEETLTTTTKDLNAAQSDLNKAQVKLKSLQAGLAAANAAALAS